MTKSRYIAIILTFLGLVVAYNTEVQGAIGIAAGVIMIFSYTWLFLDLTE